MSHDAKAYHAAWHLAHRADQLAQSRARYQRHRQEVIAARRAYRRTAAGMLTGARHAARQRGTR